MSEASGGGRVSGQVLDVWEADIVRGRCGGRTYRQARWMDWNIPSSEIISMVKEPSFMKPTWYILYTRCASASTLRSQGVKNRRPSRTTGTASSV
jgi:hypothetical protein